MKGAVRNFSSLLDSSLSGMQGGTLEHVIAGKVAFGGPSTRYKTYCQQVKNAQAMAGACGTRLRPH